MTELNRERLIELMVDCPEKLSESDVEAIRTDSELRDIYEISRRLRTEAAVPTDLDAEWTLFNQKLAQSRHKRPQWRRIAAAIAITLAVSATATIIFAPFDFIIPSKQAANENIEQTTIPVSAPVSAALPERIPVETEEFENMTLSEIMARISAIYGCDVNIGKDVNENLRLYFIIEAGQSLDETIELLDAFEALDVSLVDGTIVVK